MTSRLSIVIVLSLAGAPAAWAQPLAPVAPASAVVIVEHPAEIPGQPRIVLARADDPAPSGGAEPGSPEPAPSKDPFARLKKVIPKDKLPPIRSVRVGAGKKSKVAGEKKNISVTVGSSPSGASVRWGGKNLGVTPLSISAPEGSTPINIVLRAGRRMTLRTRILRDKSRSYYYKLHPAKMR